MASVLKICTASLAELVAYLWRSVYQLLLQQWDYWRRPRCLPPVRNDLLLRSATSLAADIRTGEVESVRLVSAYIERIEELQPFIDPVVEERFEEALQFAEVVDFVVESGVLSVQQLREAKPLLGVPFSVKCSIAVKAMRQHAGSLRRRGQLAVEDAPSVARMCLAGAIPLVLTNLPGVGSGGEASLLASAGSLIGLGTDYGGSVRTRSAYCGIFGHKPTDGAGPNIGRSPLEAQNIRDDCICPMARYAEDLPLLLKVLAGGSADHLRLDQEVDLTALKVFFTETDESLHPNHAATEAHQGVEKVTRHLQEAAGSDIRLLQVPELQHILFTWFNVAAKRRPRLLGLNAEKAFNDFLRTLRIAGRRRLDQFILVKICMAVTSRFPTRREAAAFCSSVGALGHRLEESLGDDGVLVLPVATRTGSLDLDMLSIDSAGMTALFSILNVPATVCPVGKSTSGQPLAVQVVANRGNDRLCLAVAKEIERHFGGWILP
ncbi:fatty-acid amide hydrolase 2-A-like [Amblyomma americanum]